MRILDTKEEKLISGGWESAGQHVGGIMGSAGGWTGGSRPQPSQQASQWGRPRSWQLRFVVINITGTASLSHRIDRMLTPVLPVVGF